MLINSIPKKEDANESDAKQVPVRRFGSRVLQKVA
jgi:hypothetical protein